MKKIVVNGISVELERKRIRNLSVKAPDARVHVSVPWPACRAELRNYTTVY